MTSVSVSRTVGRYEILREVGRGGTAVVYLSRQTDLDRAVALKELSAFRAADPAFVERFLRESRLTGSLSHPNIVTVHEYFEHDGTGFIAMEYFERGSLRPFVGKLQLPQVVGVLEGVLAGLTHAESHGIVHRDLKPENVMVTSGGGVKIADFGMAKALEIEAGGDLTSSGTTVGTPAYMAPEQAVGRDIGLPTDLYSVGVIAYELLAGRVPFDQNEPPMAIMLRHLHDPVPPLRSLNPDVDPRVAAWVERLLAKESADRPRGAAEAWEELEERAIDILGPRWRRQSRLTETRVAAVRPEPRTTPATEALRAAHRSRRARLAWLLAGLTLLGAGSAAAAVLLLTGGSEPRAEPPTTPEKTRPRPVEGPVLSKVVLVRSGSPVTASLRLTGAALAAGSIRVPDRNLADGRAVLELRARGVAARARGGTYGPLRLHVTKGRDLIRVEVTAKAGSFTTLQARRRDGHTVLVEAERPKPKPPAHNTTTAAPTAPSQPTSRPTYRTQTKTSTSPTPKKPEKPKPVIETG